ncbi:MAG: acylphosphatase [Erysipelotrichaceae bacterium]|nr:acylphosphatase [Erysipelotrichaceae bacterium]
MKRYLIIYKGIVQGVGFRDKAIQCARRHQLTGYVRNTLAGDVECEVQGEEVDLFVKETIAGDRFIKVFDYSIKQIPLKEDERNFTVRF